MTAKIAINGFGRIGRLVLRNILRRRDIDLDVVAINDLTDNETLAHLFEFDSVHGRWPGKVGFDAESIVVDGRRIAAFAERDPASLPWGALGVDLVIESTGRFRERSLAAKHLEAGAKRVLLSAPGKGVDATVVLGVNEDTLRPEHRIVSNASCTTNCLAPLVKVLDEAFGFEHGVMNTVHAYTNDQVMLDGPHKDLRRARAGAANIVPTTTGAAKAVGTVYPKVAGKLHGMALRVPVPDGSIVILVAQLAERITADEVNDAFRTAAQGALEGILRVEDKPVVVSDIVGDPHSSIVDALSTFTVAERTVHVMSWYDNEFGYANRCVELAEKLAAL